MKNGGKLITCAECGIEIEEGPRILNGYYLCGGCFRAIAGDDGEEGQADRLAVKNKKEAA